MDFSDPSNIREPSKMRVTPATLATDKNKGTITFARGAARGFTLEVKANSSTEQHVLIDIDGKETLVAGSGENDTSLKSFRLPNSAVNITATFSHGNDKSTLKPATRLLAGGPYSTGQYVTMAIVAENGDDEDNNDAVLEIRGYVPPFCV
jgi:hypothetical protein